MDLIEDSCELLFLLVSLTSFLVSKVSEEVTLEKLQSEELSLLTNIGQMAAEFFSLFNGPLLISLQYYRDRASLMVQTVKNSPASVGDAGSSSLIV